MDDDAPVDGDAPIEPRRYPRWPRARILRYVGAGLAVVLVVAVGKASAVSVTNSLGCCGQDVPLGEIWYCREPDAAHAVGELYLLGTTIVDEQPKPGGGRGPWPGRVETGHVGTPLLWQETPGVVVLAVDLAVVPHTNTLVPDETTATVVREGQVTVVRDTGLAKAGSACPSPPTTMSTPRG